MFKNSVDKLNEREVIIELVTMLNNANFEVVLQGAISLNKLMNPLGYITNHGEVAMFCANLVRGLNGLIFNGIINKLLLVLSMDFSYSNLNLLYMTLKIFCRFINISTFLLELHNFSKSNELGFTKSIENEITSLKDFVDGELIPKLIGRINSGLEISNVTINNITSILALIISKRGMQQMNQIFTETNFMTFVLRKIDILISQEVINYTDWYNELRKSLYYCVYTAYLISTLKENYSTYFDMINTTLNKLLVVADNLRNAFFMIDDQVFQFYYFIFIGFITKRTNFDDKSFSARAQSVVTKNLNLLVRPYLFYVKSIVNSKSKQDTMSFIVKD